MAIISIMDNPLELPYYQSRIFTVQISGQELQVISKPGLPHWDEVTPTIHLLAEAAVSKKDGLALLLGCGNGVLGVVLARQGGAESLALKDTNWIALRVAKNTLAENGFHNVPVEPLHYPLPDNTYQTVIMNLPKGRKLARRWLVESWSALKPGGELYLAGANPEGIQSVIQDAKNLFGNAVVLAYRKGCRVARSVKQSRSEDTLEPWITAADMRRGSWIEFSTEACSEYFTLRSLPGLFSFDRVDEGTDLLLQTLSPEQVQDRRVLDFGCGYGLIGMAAARLGARGVDLLDVDLSAVAAAQENCLRNKINHARVLPSDVLDAVCDERYDLIISNPPFHAGKEVEYGMAHTFIAHSRYILIPTGRLVLVANRFIRYDRLMMEVFGNVKSLSETGKFHVLESIR